MDHASNQVRKARALRARDRSSNGVFAETARRAMARRPGRWTSQGDGLGRDGPPFGRRPRGDGPDRNGPGFPFRPTDANRGGGPPRRRGRRSARRAVRGRPRPLRADARRRSCGRADRRDGCRLRCSSSGPHGGGCGSSRAPHAVSAPAISRRVRRAVAAMRLLPSPPRSTPWPTILTARAEALAASDRARRQLLADVSHELTTPVTAMRGYLETLTMPELDAGPGDQGAVSADHCRRNGAVGAHHRRSARPGAARRRRRHVGHCRRAGRRPVRPGRRPSRTRVRTATGDALAVDRARCRHRSRRPRSPGAGAAKPRGKRLALCAARLDHPSGRQARSRQGDHVGPQTRARASRRSTCPTSSIGSTRRSLHARSAERETPTGRRRPTAADWDCRL